ncbi:winged helix-turn-helix domain-containing protein [Bradyrhizobium sp. CB1650]|uniref:ATP-binding protein n=1 Tax=Bradyrhizobium sp. CB1650 TaxID=3039153 RepID=UPI0024359465|nr:winged helix-turn-helix domain-containing protein [Bradyrhizobium sp. CB1650]WGD50309.1 winged helix-turn-helix domain-containing protein [Bradyrhizobium sp. CB1650]
MSEQVLLYRSGEWEVDLLLRELRVRGSIVPVGGRSFEILQILVQAAPKHVTKDELMSRVWPGSMVNENTIEVHISAIRKALGKDRDLLRTASGRGYRLIGNWIVTSGAVRRPQPVGQSAGVASTSLPSFSSELFGRGAALEDLRGSLSANRLVTVTGPGGIGKTRLAIDAARGLLRDFHGQCAFVDLAPLVDPALVPSTVSTALGLPHGAEVSPAAIARAIDQQPFLIVLDNCEHVIDAVAQVADNIVQNCPHTTILSTSRELLRTEGEFVYRVPSLTVPPVEMQAPSLIASHSAVELFVARLRAQCSSLALSPVDLRTIGRVCRRLDGIPLAIEFAAAQAAILGLAHVADRLSDIFSVLVRGRRTALPRHQTLRATLDWSFGLLSVAERGCLCRLAIFAGGFTLKAAVAVVGGSDGSDEQVTDLIGNLVAKSLVTLEDFDGTPRWRLLETTRAYAREKLWESKGEQEAARRHALYFKDRFTSSKSDSGEPQVLHPLSFYRREIDNIRAALDWAFSPGGDPTIGVALTVAATPVWCQLSLLVECRSRLELALNSSEVDALDVRSRLELVAALGFVMTNSTGFLPDTIAVLESALDLAREVGDVDHQLRALWSIWTCRFNNAESRRSHEIANQFVKLASKVESDSDLLVGKRLTGVTLHYLGDQAGARCALQTMVDRYRPVYHERHRIRFQFDQLTLGRAVLARVLWLQGFADQALRLTRQNINNAVEVGHGVSTCYALAEGACPVALMARDLEAAEAYVRMLLDTAIQHNLPFWESWGRCLEAQLLVERGDAIQGVQALITAINAFRDGGWGTRLPELLGASGKALGLVGRALEGISTVDEALALSAKEGERWCTADLLRIKGELLLRSHPDHGLTEAELLFRQSLSLAKQQGALAFELRVAMSLARIGTLQNEPTALVPLSLVYRRFKEGFDTPDLREARAWLATEDRVKRAI